MSTHASIAVEHEDGTISAVYCHFDGYLSGVGKDLVAHFNSLKAAEELIKKGDLSGTNSSEGKPKYYTDDGEDFEDVKPRFYQNLGEYLKKIGDDICGEYDYLFTDGEWKVLSNSRVRLKNTSKLIPVKNAEEVDE